ncbi:MAG: hypothetical protein COC06_01640 [Bacteroidales bacterium]|nr:MAG: hypothetical protein COC06_01640 [Bacteroidales bacterium]
MEKFKQFIRSMLRFFTMLNSPSFSIVGQNYIILPLSVAILMVGSLTLFASCDKINEGTIIEEEEIPEEEEEVPTEEFVLQLTPNECFFDPAGTLTGVKDPTQTGTDYNRGTFLTHITDWSVKSDTILWGVEFKKTGQVSVIPVMGVISSQAGSEIEVIMGDQKATLVVTETGSLSTFESQEEVTFTISQVGLHVLKFHISNLATSGMIGDLKAIDLKGEAVEEAEVYLRRWRPLAVHGKWRNSQNPQEISISVHENTIITTDIEMYQPITTPFGYTGSNWDSKKQIFGGYNFSLWSYGANDEVPPFYQESHLIAVGEGLVLGTYGHEGTGVKPRGQNPYLNKKTNKQVIAVRMEPGTLYNTFWSYYLDPETEHWKFYGCGRKYNKDADISYLEGRMGAFVEVPGAATKKRNGHIIREVQYRGWMMDVNENWYPIDNMVHGGNDSQLSYKNWGVTDDGSKFYMQMGGLLSEVKQSATLELSNPSPLPNFLQGSYLDELFAMPAQMEALAPVSISENSVTLQFNITDKGTNPQAHLFYGTSEGLTKQYEWDNEISIDLTDGINTPVLTDLNGATEYYYQLRITNDEGVTWLMDTQTLTTE